GFAMLWDKAAVVMLMPEMHLDAQGRVHNAAGPAVRFRGIGGDALYYWHNIKVPEPVIMRPETLTAADIAANENSEVARAIAERLGWPRYLAIAGAILIDTWTDPFSGCRYELYALKNHKDKVMPRLLKMESPLLQDGSKPSYIEPVSPKLKSCRAARQWQFRKPNSEWPSEEECNREQNVNFTTET
ncbi:MAG: DUF6745 domain-containing protein, partial [Elusimicrobiota bacterium]